MLIATHVIAGVSKLWGDRFQRKHTEGEEIELNLLWEDPDRSLTVPLFIPINHAVDKITTWLCRRNGTNHQTTQHVHFRTNKLQEIKFQFPSHSSTDKFFLCPSPSRKRTVRRPHIHPLPLLCSIEQSHVADWSDWHWQARFLRLFICRGSCCWYLAKNTRDFTNIYTDK